MSPPIPPPRFTNTNSFSLLSNTPSSVSSSFTIQYQRPSSSKTTHNNIIDDKKNESVKQQQQIDERQSNNQQATNSSLLLSFENDFVNDDLLKKVMVKSGTDLIDWG